jgi:hypothetical protein
MGQSVEPIGLCVSAHGIVNGTSNYAEPPPGPAGGDNRMPQPAAGKAHLDVGQGSHLPGRAPCAYLRSSVLELDAEPLTRPHLTGGLAEAADSADSLASGRNGGTSIPAHPVLLGG